MDLRWRSAISAWDGETLSHRGNVFSLLNSRVDRHLDREAGI